MMNFDPWKEADEGEAVAKNKISQLSGYEDLADFYVMHYTDDELIDLDEDPGNWVGQYVKGSVLSDRGTVVLINIDKHNDRLQIADTLTHEIGHALWELLDKKSQKKWKNDSTVKSFVELEGWNHEEVFADDFMRLVRGEKRLMANTKLFIELTAL